MDNHYEYWFQCLGRAWTNDHKLAKAKKDYENVFGDFDIYGEEGEKITWYIPARAFVDKQWPRVSRWLWSKDEKFLRSEEGDKEVWETLMACCSKLDIKAGRRRDQNYRAGATGNQTYIKNKTKAAQMTYETAKKKGNWRHDWKTLK